MLANRRVRLKPVTASDTGFLSAIALDESTGPRWRLRGAAPSPADVELMLWSGVVSQYIVVPTSQPATGLGVVQLTNASLKNRYAYFGIALHPQAQMRGWPIDAVALLIDHSFATWDFRKLYAELPEPSYREVASGSGRLFDHEARLRNHEYIAGSYRDVHIISIDVERWSAVRPRFVRLGVLES